jgi:hypothetical protein
MSKSNVIYLNKNFRKPVEVQEAPMSPEKKAEIIALGKASNIADEDLPIRLGTVVAGQLGHQFNEDLQNLLKGQIVQHAKNKGIPPEQVIESFKLFFNSNNDMPKYDA